MSLYSELTKAGIPTTPSESGQTWHRIVSRARIAVGYMSSGVTDSGLLLANVNLLGSGALPDNPEAKSLLQIGIKPQDIFLGPPSPQTTETRYDLDLTYVENETGLALTVINMMLGGNPLPLIEGDDKNKGVYQAETPATGGHRMILTAEPLKQLSFEVAVALLNAQTSRESLSELLKGSGEGLFDMVFTAESGSDARRKHFSMTGNQ